MREQRKGQRRTQDVHQGNLFQPASQRPTWASLPLEVRHIVSELVVKILREARERSVVGSGAEPQATREDADE